MSAKTGKSIKTITHKYKSNNKLEANRLHIQNFSLQLYVEKNTIYACLPVFICRWIALIHVFANQSLLIMDGLSNDVDK